ncbi:unnamed protein product [Toxocara canis]|uniref:NB-ARC domain-containing protein n=1 Tax=Toxocara canis TaxID=6265 RepID=A0A183VE84_TOXCA|nr:unnamed protein product [Toxocara canis]
MEDIKLDGLIVIKDSVDCNGERLWISFVEKARRSFTKVRLLLTVTWSDTLERRYGCVRKEGVSLESVDRLDTLLTILNGIDGQENDRTAFFIDSINMLLMWCSSIDQMIRLLKALAGKLINRPNLELFIIKMIVVVFMQI